VDDVILISVFAAGCLAGLIVFVNLFNYIYSKFRNQTIFFLIGLILGSGYALWPFKKYQLVDLYMKIDSVISKVPDYKVYSNKLCLFENVQQLWPVLISFAAGAAIMLFFIRYENKNKASA
jgi:putative membrane protein